MSSGHSFAQTPVRGHDASSARSSPRGFVFVHSLLDDAGLSPEAFRVLAHIARRAGECGAWPSLSSMAETCRMGERRTKEAIRELVKRGAITLQVRAGRTNIYRLTDPNTWVDGDDPRPEPARVQKDPPSEWHPHPPPNWQGDPGSNRPPEGYPARESNKEIQPSCVAASASGGEGASHPDTITAETIYEAYPRRAARKEALRAIRKAMASPPAGRARPQWPRELLERTQHYRRRRTGEPEQYTPHAATWFNQERYLDPPDNPAPARTTPSSKPKTRTLRNTI